MAIAYLNHTPIGKSTQAKPYTARAHVWYITRPHHTDYTYSERMPLHRHAVMRFVTKREDAIRKNGRVCDKFIIALPREQSMEQNVDTLRDFGFRLSQGRASFFFSIQDYGTDNPHAHFLFVDADHKTGERVAFTSEKGSTERIKATWAGTVNQHLLENGIEAQIEFGAPLRPEVPLEPVNDNEEKEPAEESELVIQYGLLPIQSAVRAYEELTMLRAERRALEVMTSALEMTEQQRDKMAELAEQARVQAMEAERLLEVAKSNLLEHTKANGKLKGVHLKIMSFEWKSHSRKEAEEAQRLTELAERAQREADADKVDAAYKKEVADRIVTEVTANKTKVKHQLATRGTPEELNEAEELLDRTKNKYMAGLSVDDVQEAYKVGNLTESEYLNALEMMGELDLIEEHERVLET